MTRVNVVPVTELCDQHLLAEHREITRIPNCVAKGRYNLKGQPLKYTMGTGHVKFFYDKLFWLNKRYKALTRECVARGFNIQNIWPDLTGIDVNLKKDYAVTEDALCINRERIKERLSTMSTPRWTKGE